jgi:hypothetical protein
LIDEPAREQQQLLLHASSFKRRDDMQDARHLGSRPF